MNGVPLGRIGGDDGQGAEVGRDIAPRPEGGVPSLQLPAAQPHGGGGAGDEIGNRKVILVGTIIVLFFFGLFGAWAVFAPLDSAAIASGSVSVENSRRTVQHLEGGIVEEILVRDGNRVDQGQTLVRLAGTQPQAQLELIRGQRIAAQARAARLRAERDGNEGIAFPDELLEQQDDPRVQDTMLGQLGIFEARRDAIDGQRQILRQRVAQFEEEITGLQAQIRSADSQLVLIRDELKGLQTLFEKGLTPKSRVLALQRREAEIQGQRGQNIAAIARARQNIAEAEIRILEVRTEQVNEVVAELREVETQLLDLQERLRAAEDVQQRTEVVSPSDGVVVDMQVHTPGQVIQPGQRVLDIVPENVKLVIDARVSPTDIDVVRAGLPAQVRLVAFNQRVTPTVEGSVARVSADRLTDQQSGESYYTAQIELDESAGSKLQGLTLTPGMPAEVLIRTGERTLLQYLVSPVRQSLTRSLTEQ